MLILFPSDPFEAHKPDEAWVVEIEAAKAAGADVAYVHWESLVNDDDAKAAVRKVPESDPGTKAIYRGWMLTSVQYLKLYSALEDHRNVTLLTHPQFYQNAHHLPGWYSFVKDQTPRSVWVDMTPGSVIEKTPEEALAAAVELLESCPNGIIVKDYVKSRKHEWKDACFIPNVGEAPRVIGNFLERQGDDLQTGLVFREYVKLFPLGSHPQSNMPMSLEYRIFVFNGSALRAPMEYWPEAKYPDLSRIDPPLEIPSETLDLVGSPFYSLDVAMTEDGRWLIMEIGDGQVSGLPNAAHARAFYESLVKAYADVDK